MERRHTPQVLSLPSAARVALGAIALACAVVTTGLCSAPALGATGATATTVSYYEGNVDPSVLASQGASAGQTGSQGLVILDFGRPAVNGSVPGTMDFDGNFVSLASIASGTMDFIQAYLLSAPPNLHLHVAIGTNDSCGTGQPCGSGVCGCQNEPSSFAWWGAQFAQEVEAVQSQTNALRQQQGDTDVVTVVAGDDAEPAFDPGYQNTYDLLSGYANQVGGFQPAMIDYGSAEPGYWSMNQLLQVVNGFSPDIAVPEVYNAAAASSWAALVSFAANQGQTVTVFGVLTDASGGDNPQEGYGSLLNAIGPITGQSAIRWASSISH
jgi:hypothetical protein